MEKINVLHVMSALETASGGERYLLYLLKKLNKERYRSLVVYSHEGKLLKDMMDLGIEIVVINMRNKFRFKSILEISRFIKSKDIQIVHAHGIRADFFARLAAKMAKAPVVVSARHNSINDYPVNALIKKCYILLDKLTTPFTDKIITVADALANDLINISKIRKDKVITVHNGVDLDEFNIRIEGQAIKKEFGIKATNPVIGFVGRIYPEKGHRYFMQAASKIRDCFPDARFVMVGDGPLRQEVEDLAKELNISANCIFTGFRSDVSEIISAFDIGVLPSLKEGFPLAILEYMAMAKPVVATSICGNPEAVEDGVTGILVPAEDPQALADAVINLLQNKIKAQNMGKAGRAMVEQRFNTERMAKDIEKIYEELLEKNKKL